MAKGHKTGGRDFLPGQSGNPKGKPKLTPEQREFRSAAKNEIIEEFKYLWSLPIEEIQEIAAPEEEIFGNTPLIRIAIAKALLKAAQTGDMHQLNQILDRVIGKVKEEIDHNVKGNIHVQLVDLINNLEGKEGLYGNEEEDDQEDDT